MALAVSSLFFLLLFTLCFGIIFYSKTTHYKTHFSPEVRQKKRTQITDEQIKALHRKRDLALQRVKDEKAASKIALAAETKAAVGQIKALALPAALGNLSAEPPITPEESRVGGPVFLPENISYPLDTNGNPMLFIVQINFSELPNVPGYPETGIFQIFAQANEMLGMDDPDNEHGCKNRQFFFWKNTETLKTRFDPIEVYPDVLLYRRDRIEGKSSTTTAENIHQNGRKILFNPDVKNIIPWLTYDYPVPKILGDEFEKHAFLGDHVQEAIDGTNPEAQIMIGGYPRSSQHDPRFHTSEETEYTRVLLTMRSLGEIQIGDNDDLNVLIRPEDLENQDVSKVIYDIF